MNAPLRAVQPFAGVWAGLCIEFKKSDFFQSVRRCSPRARHQAEAWAFTLACSLQNRARIKLFARSGGRKATHDGSRHWI
jgi:hypothetical protein